MFCFPSHVHVWMRAHCRLCLKRTQAACHSWNPVLLPSLWSSPNQQRTIVSPPLGCCLFAELLVPEPCTSLPWSIYLC